MTRPRIEPWSPEPLGNKETKPNHIQATVSQRMQLRYYLVKCKIDEFL